MGINLIADGCQGKTAKKINLGYILLEAGVNARIFSAAISLLWWQVHLECTRLDCRSSRHFSHCETGLPFRLTSKRGRSVWWHDDERCPLMQDSLWLTICELKVTRSDGVPGKFVCIDKNLLKMSSQVLRIIYATSPLSSLCEGDNIGKNNNTKYLVWSINCRHYILKYCTWYTTSSAWGKILL